MSLVALLGSPQAYEGKLIRVEDFSTVRTSRIADFSSAGDFEYYVVRNSVLVGWPGCRDRRVAAKVKRRYARIEGIFEADIGAGFGSEVREVRSIQPLESREHFSERIGASWWLDLWPWLQLGVLFVAATTAASYLIVRRAQRHR